MSTKDQSEASQDPDNQRYCAERGYSVAETYTVHGKSAFHDGELDGDWGKVVDDVKSGRIKVVVIWKVDRLDRQNIMHAVPMVNMVLKAGGRVEFSTQPYIDLTNSAGRMAFGNFCEMAFEESRIKSERVTAKHTALRSAGSFIGRAPWGYVIVTRDASGKTIVPTAEGLRLVPEIFRRVIKGQSLATVAAWLEAETGRSWWPRTIGTMIRNTAYAGYCRDVSGKTTHRCEPLVDAATFRRAGLALDTRPKRGPQTAAGRALLAGVCFCPRCPERSPMYKIVPRGGVPYYRCSGRGSQRKGCGNMLPLAKVDATVHRFMSDWTEPVMVRTLVPGHDHSAETEAIKFELRQLDPDAADYDSQHAALRSRLAELKALPSVPDSWADTDTGQTYAGRWAEQGKQGNAERTAWLASAGLSVWASADAIEVRRADGFVLRASFV